ncbi:hypothetical protein DFH28DRAFT_889095 [Melampsora americana]|nr:hypothetical protein DFH28DRAFT_889095 [Melampsora americana]
MKFQILFYTLFIIQYLAHHSYSWHNSPTESSQGTEVHEPVRNQLQKRTHEIILTKKLFAKKANIEEFKTLSSLKNMMPDSLILCYLLGRLKGLASQIKKYLPWSAGKFPSHVFETDGEFDKAISLATKALEIEELTTRDKVWLLAVFTNLQGYLPQGGINPLNTDVIQRTSSRATILLHLTKDLDLISATQALWASHTEPPLVDFDRSLAEAYSRITILDRIKSRLGTIDHSNLSEFVLRTYDVLIQEICPMPGRELEKLLQNCLKILLKPDGAMVDQDIAYRVLHEYSKVSHRAKEIAMEGIKEESLSFMKRFEVDMLIRNLINLRRDYMGTHFATLISPFIKLQEATMQNFEHIVEVLVDDSFRSPQSKEIPMTEHQMIQLLYQVADHIDGARPYLCRQVEWRMESQRYAVKRPQDTEDTSGRDICTICLSGIEGNGDIVDLEHGSSHRFHKKCLRVGPVSQLTINNCIAWIST